MALMTVILGGGGVAREVAWLLWEVGARAPDLFVIADGDWTEGQAIDGVRTIPDRDFDVLEAPVEAYLAVGLPRVRRKLHERLRRRADIRFPSLLHDAARMDGRPGKTRIGQGVVVYPLASLTTGVSLGDFAQINPGATLGHGARIGCFTTVCPGANLSGDVVVGSGCFIGAGVVVKEGVRIVDDCTIGAGAVVVSDITEAGTWVGVPARKIA